MPRSMTIEQFQRWLQRFPRELEGAVVEGIQEAAMRGPALVVEEIDRLKLNDTGALRQSVNVRLEKGGAVLSVDAPYAAVVEYGRRPGARMPPVEPIRLWAERKLGLEAEDAAEAAFGIALSIAITGTRPKRFFRKALGRLKPIAEKAIIDALRRYRP